MDKRGSREGCCRYDTRTQLLGNTRRACIDGDDLVGDTEGTGRGQRGGGAGGDQQARLVHQGKPHCQAKHSAAAGITSPVQARHQGERGSHLTME